MANTLKPLFGGPNPGLEQLAKRAASSDLLTTIVQRELPGGLGVHVIAAIRRDGDLVISVDTSFGHVAGALGVPTWLMLAFAPDWRWLLAREDTPWYPSMRLFRQSRQADWIDVVARVRAALEARRIGTPRAALAGLTPRRGPITRPQPVVRARG